MTESELKLDLMLPVEKIHLIGDETFFSFDEQEFRIILKVYATYQVLAKINKRLYEIIENTENQRDVAIVTNYKCVDVLKSVDEERKIVHKIRNAERHDVAIRERKSKVKTALIAAGSGLAGVGIGVIIGLFAVRR